MTSQDITSPLAFAEGLFIFMNYFHEKEGFSKPFAVLLLKYRKIEKLILLT
jgi:hypothetical protein